MMPDTRVISRHASFAVLGERQAVVFRDLSVVHLHSVQKDGVDQTYHRALCLDGTTWCVFDLRRIHRDFAIDFPALFARDHAGVVLYTLRAEFPSSAQFIATAFREFGHVWPAEAEMAAIVIHGEPMPDRMVFQPELRRAAA